MGASDDTIVRESLAWLAVPSAGLLLPGVIAVIALTSRELFAPRVPD